MDGQIKHGDMVKIVYPNDDFGSVHDMCVFYHNQLGLIEIYENIDVIFIQNEFQLNRDHPFNPRYFRNPDNNLESFCEFQVDKDLLDEAKSRLVLHGDPDNINDDSYYLSNITLRHVNYKLVVSFHDYKYMSDQGSHVLDSTHLNLPGNLSDYVFINQS